VSKRSKLSKSPLAVAGQALAIGNRVLPLYAHKFSPRKFTQPQLFACLVLKTFLKTDYRGLAVFLDDFDALRWLLGLKTVPHFTTFQKASRKLLRASKARRLFNATIRRFLKRRHRLKRVAVDSTGLECGHRSLYYVRRRHGTTKRWQTVAYSRYAKLEAAFDCQSHLMVAALVGRGPRPDINRFVPLLDAVLSQVDVDSVLGDAGFDSEPNHRYARDRNGVRSFMPATHGRPTTKLPTGKYRRRMKQRLNKNYGRYGQRWQAETGFSMVKRRLASMVNGRGYWSQCRDLSLLAISYNVLLLYAAAGFLQSRS
jgi:Transposase DDE domain